MQDNCVKQTHTDAPHTHPARTRGDDKATLLCHPAPVPFPSRKQAGASHLPGSGGRQQAPVGSGAGILCSPAGLAQPCQRRCQPQDSGSRDPGTGESLQICSEGQAPPSPRQGEEEEHAFFLSRPAAAPGGPKRQTSKEVRNGTNVFLLFLPAGCFLTWWALAAGELQSRTGHGDKFHFSSFRSWRRHYACFGFVHTTFFLGIHTTFSWKPQF